MCSVIFLIWAEKDRTNGPGGGFGVSRTGTTRHPKQNVTRLVGVTRPRPPLRRRTMAGAVDLAASQTTTRFRRAKRGRAAQGPAAWREINEANLEAEVARRVQQFCRGRAAVVAPADEAESAIGDGPRPTRGRRRRASGSRATGNVKLCRGWAQMSGSGRPTVVALGAPGFQRWSSFQGVQPQERCAVGISNFTPKFDGPARLAPARRRGAAGGRRGARTKSTPNSPL